MRKDRNDYQGAQIARTDLAPAAFILFALIGGTLVSLSKFYPVHLGIVIAVPVLVVVLYTVVAWSLPRLELRRDQIGDNAYYLGFLLTLISLTTTLIQYNSQAKEDFIVSNFGVALSATIAGIAIRSFISQMRKDIVGIEREMHASLRESSTKLKSQMYSSVEGFGSLHRQMAQITDESTKIVAEAHRKFAKGLNSIIDERVAILDKQIDSSCKAMSVRTEKVIGEIESCGRAFVNATKAEQSALSDTTAFVRKSLGEFENIKLDTSSLIKIEEHISIFSDTISEKLSSASLASSRHAESIVSSAESMAEVSETVRISLKNNVRAIGVQIDLISKVVGEMQAINESLGKMGEKHSKQIHQGESSLKSAIDDIKSELNKHTEVLQSNSSKSNNFNKVHKTSLQSSDEVLIEDVEKEITNLNTVETEISVQKD